MRPRVFKVPPNLRVRGLIPGATHPAMVNAPVRVRQGIGGYNNMPGPNGAPGSSTYPYDETLQYFPPAGGAGPLQSPPAIGAPPPGLSPAAQGMISTPYGSSARDWNNPTTYATIPINASAVNSSTPILQLNYKRNSLIIQNTSTATSPDVAPTLWVNFNSAAQVGGSLALPPGLGFYWGAADCPPRDAIYITFGPFAGATVVIQGCVVQGTYVPGEGNVAQQGWSGIGG